MFIDKAKIFIKAGKGGNGAISFIVKSMLRQAVLTAVTAAKAVMLYSRLSLV